MLRTPSTCIQPLSPPQPRRQLAVYTNIAALSLPPIHHVDCAIVRMVQLPSLRRYPTGAVLDDGAPPHLRSNTDDVHRRHSEDCPPTAR
jgi:hypothetical protein